MSTGARKPTPAVLGRAPAKSTRSAKAVHRVSVAMLVFLASFLFPGIAASDAGSNPGDDGGSWELGTWAIKDYAPRVPDGTWNLNEALHIAGGFRLGMAGSLFTTIDIRENQNCKERHLRDPRFSINGNPGNDQYSFDKNDFGLFVGHGGRNTLAFANQVDRWDLEGQNARWGNWDLEWAYIFACEFTGDGGNPTFLGNDKRMMAGVHSICGFADLAIHNWNGTAQGKSWSDLMRGSQWGDPRTIIAAWIEGNDIYQPNGTRLKIWYGKYCWGDYLPGVGAYYQSDPVAFESGGLLPDPVVYECR